MKPAADVLEQFPESVWVRGDFTSVWRGPHLELVVVSPGGLESWRWTCIGWRTPDDCNEADREGWVWAPTREAAEKAALEFYLEKETN